MRPRTYRTDFAATIFLLVACLFFFGCFRAAHFEHYSQCGSDVPCRGHEGQVYCRDGVGGEWACCRCPGKVP